MRNGVDLRGICIYPVLDRPDWDTFEPISCGIWAYDPVTGTRRVEKSYLACVQRCHEKLNRFLARKEAAKAKGATRSRKPAVTF
jgi:hypothetical protein